MRLANSPTAFGADVPDYTSHPAPVAAPRARRTALDQYAQFTLVGVTNAVVDLGVLNLLLALHPTRSPLPLLLDNTLAVALAILNSYLWNTRWTFRAGVTHRRSQRALFVAQALLNIAINNVVLLAVANVLPPSLSVSTFVLNNIAKLAAMLAASTCSFLLLRLVVFRIPAPARPPA
ncbi:MAG TPA: GtrA family protein [Ktedonobacterales bacterium]|jgi:putative flippase GtrA